MGESMKLNPVGLTISQRRSPKIRELCAMQSTSGPNKLGNLSRRQPKRVKPVQPLNGIGVVLTEHDEYTGVDLDGVICKQSGDLGDTALEDCICPRILYRDQSQPEDELTRHCKGKTATQRQPTRGSVEMYDQGRFLTFTGDVYKGHTEIAANQTGVDTVHAGWIHRKATTTALSAHSGLESINDVMAALRSSEFAAIENTLKGDLDAYKSPSEAEFAVCCALISVGASDDQIDFIIRHSEICRAKWTDSRGDSTYGAITIKNARLSVNQGPDQESELINALNQRFA